MSGDFYIESTVEPQDTPPPSRASPTVFLSSSPRDLSSCSVWAPCDDDILVPCDDDTWPDTEPESKPESSKSAFSDVLPKDISDFALELWAEQPQQPMDVDKNLVTDESAIVDSPITPMELEQQPIILMEVDHRPPTIEDRPPTTDYQPSTIEDQPSTIEDQLSVVGERSPIIDNRPSTIRHRRPTETLVNVDLRETASMEVESVVSEVRGKVKNHDFHVKSTFFLFFFI